MRMKLSRPQEMVSDPLGKDTAQVVVLEIQKPGAVRGSMSGPQMRLCK